MPVSHRAALLGPGTVLDVSQKASLAGIAKLNNPLHRAYLLKEELRLVFKLPLQEAIKLLKH